MYFRKQNIGYIAPCGLTGLNRLNLEGNSISDVSSLAGLTHLKWLHLEGNDISDISRLRG